MNVKQRIGLSTHDTILKEGKKLFWFKGFDRTSIKDIAKAVGCTQGNIYNHFSSKEEILYSVLFKEMSKLINAILPLENDLDTSPIEQLKTFIGIHVEQTLTLPKGELLLFETEMRRLSPAHRGEIVQLRDTYDRILGKIIHRGVESGVFGKVNEKMFCFAISSMIVRARLWYSRKGELSTSQVSDGIFELFLNGLGLRGK